MPLSSVGGMAIIHWPQLKYQLSFCNKSNNLSCNLSWPYLELSLKVSSNTDVHVVVGQQPLGKIPGTNAVQCSNAWCNVAKNTHNWNCEVYRIIWLIPSHYNHSFQLTWPSDRYINRNKATVVPSWESSKRSVTEDKLSGLEQQQRREVPCFCTITLADVQQAL